MRKIETREIVTCDVCGKEMEPVILEDNYRMLIFNISYDVWYGQKTIIKDVCKKCNTEIIHRILDLMTGKL